MSDLFDDLEFEVLGEDFEDPFESMAGGQNLPPPPEILAPQVQPASAVLQKEESILDAGADHAPETPPPAFSEIHAAEPEDTEEERPAAGSKGGTSSEPAGTAAVNMMAAMAEAVSYTHLDVYKRQGGSCIPEAMEYPIRLRRARSTCTCTR